MPDSPFAEYLRAIDAQLAGLPPAQRDAIRRELLAHLADAAADADADPHDPALQTTVIAQLGPATELASAFGAVHGALPARLRQLARLAGVLGGLLGMLGGLLAGGLARDSGWLGALAVLTLALAGALGVAGTLLYEQKHRVWLPILLLSGVALVAGGAHMLHGALAHGLDLPAGALLLLGGELLLLSAAAHPRVVRLPRAGHWLGGLLVAALVSFVPPFSYLPNPLGAYYLLRGGYQYDPRQPLVNRFATLGADPVPLVAARLDRLLGKTGLDPLDAQAPLASYELLRVVTTAGGTMAAVEAELYYTNGSARRYRISVIQYGLNPRVQLTGVDRLLARHEALPGLPPAGADAPLHVGEPARLPLEAAAQQIFGAVLPLDGAAGDDVQWFAGGFLMMHADALWRVPSDGDAPELQAQNVAAYAVSAKGHTAALAQPLAATNPGPRYQIVIIDLASGGRRVEAVADRAAVAAAGDWFFFLRDEQLWRVPSAGGPPEQLGHMPGAGAGAEAFPLAIAPDGRRAAYRCGSDLCLADVDGAHATRIGLGFSRPAPPVQAQPGPQPTAGPADTLPTLSTLGLAWSPDGRWLAATSGATDARGHPELRIVAAGGQVARSVPLGPDGLLGTPQWSPDGRFVLLSAYPAGGRRIVAVAVGSGAVYDLSRPGWDALFSLMPDGHALLLWNGRGSFWRAPLGTTE